MLKKQLEMGAGAMLPNAVGAIDMGVVASGDSSKSVPPNSKKASSAASAAMQKVAQFQAMQQQIGLGTAANAPSSSSNGMNNPVNNPFFQGPPVSFANNAASVTSNNSIGSLPNIQSGKVNSPQLNKTDSHAVLMELFARDQDLVRRAAEAARLKQQNRDSQQFQLPPLQPIANSSSQQLFASNKSFNTMQSLSSWPQFSSVSSLTNLGMLSNVKSITNMSGADLAAQGNQAKKANLAHVKSAESMVSWFVFQSS